MINQTEEHTKILAKSMPTIHKLVNEIEEQSILLNSEDLKSAYITLITMLLYKNHTRAIHEIQLITKLLINEREEL